tara:strand:+ start:151 stop:405 length:255 start_codon:yes stop_codon:yes gene_type:complete
MEEDDPQEKVDKHGRTIRPYAVFACLMRPSTNTSLLVKIPDHVNRDNLVEWVGDEFDWGFIPMEVSLRPAHFLETWEGSEHESN